MRDSILSSRKWLQCAMAVGPRNYKQLYVDNKFAEYILTCLLIH